MKITSITRNAIVVYSNYKFFENSGCREEKYTRNFMKLFMMLLAKDIKIIYLSSCNTRLYVLFEFAI